MTATTEVKPYTPILRDEVLAIGPTMSVGQVITIRSRLGAAKEHIRETEKLLNEALLEWIDANGDIALDDNRRLYVGVTKKTTYIDRQKLFEAMLTETGGDLEMIVKCMAANAWKHGACRDVLDDKWDDHFIVETVQDVKEGVAQKSVKLADKRFMPK